MQYEVYFAGGPCAGERRIFALHNEITPDHAPQSAVSLPLYAYKNLSNGPWHYYALCTTSTARIPHHYEYLGSAEAVFSDVSDAREYFATLA